MTLDQLSNQRKMSDFVFFDARNAPNASHDSGISHREVRVHTIDDGLSHVNDALLVSQVTVTQYKNYKKRFALILFEPQNSDQLRAAVEKKACDGVVGFYKSGKVTKTASHSDSAVVSSHEKGFGLRHLNGMVSDVIVTLCAKNTIFFCVRFDDFLSAKSRSVLFARIRQVYHFTQKFGGSLVIGSFAKSTSECANYADLQSLLRVICTY